MKERHVSPSIAGEEYMNKGRVKIFLEDLKSGSNKHATNRTLIVLAVWFVVIATIPFWWVTTTVYRAAIPFAEIRAWKGQLNISYPIHIRFHIHTPVLKNSNNPDVFTENVKRVLETMDSEKKQGENRACLEYVFTNQIFPYQIITLAEMMAKMESVMKSMHQHHKSPKVKGINHNYGDYDIFMTCSEANKEDIIHVTALRSVFLQFKSCDSIETRVASIISMLFEEEAKILGSRALSSDNALSDGTPTKHDHNAMRAMKYAPKYQVTISLLNGDPRDILVDWDAESAVNVYLLPFFAALEEAAVFLPTSDLQHHASLPLIPESNGTEFLLRTSMLPHFINSAEWNLVGASTFPPIHLIVYVPPAKFSPLYVLKSDGQKLNTNAFLIPQWGGIIISNPPPLSSLSLEEGKPLPLSYHYTPEEMRYFMEIFIEQLRGLVGVRRNRIPRKVAFFDRIQVASSPIGISGWEIDELFRKLIVDNMVGAVSTLNSLATLIENLQSMVVLDGIQEKVVQALKALNECKKAVAAHNYTAAMRFGQRAKVLADDAFFDPTMVSMLYFPDEHKFAVYMPFFVPVFVPMLVALMREIKLRLQRRKEAANIKAKTE